MPPPPPAPPPPTFNIANTNKPKLNNNESKGRNQLLQSIQGGSCLKSSKHLMIDKSGPTLGTNNNNKPTSNGPRPHLPAGGARGGFSPPQTKEPAQNVCSPQLAGLFSGGMPTLRKTGQRAVNTGSANVSSSGQVPFKSASTPAPFKSTAAAFKPTSSAPVNQNRTNNSVPPTKKKWPTVNTNQSTPQIVKSSAKSMAEKFNTLQSSVAAPPPPPQRAPINGPPAPNTNRGQGPPPPPLRNISKSPQPPPTPQRSAPSPNFGPKVNTNVKQQPPPPPPPARAPTNKPPPPPPSRNVQPSIQRTPSVNSVKMRNGSAIAHPPTPPSRNSRHSTGVRLSTPSHGYASSLASYDIDFEKKYTFANISQIPQPRPYHQSKKSYPSKHRSNPAINNPRSRTTPAPPPPPR